MEKPPARMVKLTMATGVVDEEKLKEAEEGH